MNSLLGRGFPFCFVRIQFTNGHPSRNMCCKKHTVNFPRKICSSPLRLKISSYRSRDNTAHFTWSNPPVLHGRSLLRTLRNEAVEEYSSLVVSSSEFPSVSSSASPLGTYPLPSALSPLSRTEGLWWKKNRLSGIENAMRDPHVAKRPSSFTQ